MTMFFCVFVVFRTAGTPYPSGSIEGVPDSDEYFYFLKQIVLGTNLSHKNRGIRGLIPWFLAVNGLYN